MLLIGNGQLPTALRTAAAQNLAAILGAHALTEAMLVGPFSSGWLKSPFHCIVNLRILYLPLFLRDGKGNFFLLKQPSLSRRRFSGK